MKNLLLLALAALAAGGAPAAEAGSSDADGVALLAVGRYREALAVFDKSLARRPRDAQALANRCTARYKLSDFDGAIADFEAAVRLKPSLKPKLAAQASDAYYRRACLRIGRREPGAEKDLYASVRLDRTYALPYAKLGELALAGGDPGTALGYLDRALSLAPGQDDARALRAGALLETGQAAKALADADALVISQPSSAAHLRLRARVHRALGGAGAAEKDERRAAELEPAP